MGSSPPLVPASQRKLSVALTLGIVLEAIEILHRVPRWLLLLSGFLVYLVIWTVLVYRWWILGVLATSTILLPSGG